jgi:hypothetical protein
MFIVIVCPLPLILCFWINGNQSGRKAALLALAVVCAASWLLLRAPLAIMDFVYYLGMAVAVGEVLNRGKNTFVVIAWAAAIAGMARFISFVAVAMQYEQGVAAFWDLLFQQIANDYIYPGISGQQNLEYAQAFIAAVQKLAPAIVVISSMFTVWLNLWAINHIARRAGRQFPYQRLSEWRAPANLAWAFIAAAALCLLAPGNYVWIGANFMAVIGVLYLVQGIIVINCQAAYLCQALNISDAWRIIGLLMLALILLTLVNAALLAGIVIITGLFDTWFNLRKRKGKLSGG